ncbi:MULTISPECIES: MarR family winged helix-turn-helix transcriptional regulator [Streptomyces]|uniref:MarR family transcriptional regulator n=1 Tax=Streptomyces glycanivorans TaxID=3033808 RepID=A0ABY9J8D7_9ACTN|nr:MULTISPECIES: MarR family transcriptional regulator [unclassified Streptomyces]TXS18171.1 MarR family transcriptional regulator [Streptomyces sp. wa22]WLQ64055.1 MarR family transcriptional regulator [Streptomyces sp. Alt3]
MHKAPTTAHQHASDVVPGIGEVLELLEVAWERSRDALGTAPLSAAQTRVMYIIEREPGIILSALGRHLSAAAPSVTRLCDRLQAAGFLRRFPHPHNRREVQVELTESGLTHLRAIRHRREQALRQAVDRMPHDDQLALATGLRALCDAAGDPLGAPLRRETA